MPSVRSNPAWQHMFQSPTSNHSEDLGGGGSSGLRDILEKYFLPALNRQKGMSSIEDAFLSQTEQPGALFGAAKTSAEGYANQLFAPGGQIASMIGSARGDIINKGFAPSSADSGVNNILRAGTKQVADKFSENAGQLEQTRYGALAGAYGQREQNMKDLIESLFTGVASAEQLNIAKHPPRQKFLGLFAWVPLLLLGAHLCLSSLLA